ncbi:hypothetical protein PCE1_001579 [Barthelona sp. PCE]
MPRVEQNDTEMLERKIEELMYKLEEQSDVIESKDRDIMTLKTIAKNSRQEIEELVRENNSLQMQLAGFYPTNVEGNHHNVNILRNLPTQNGSCNETLSSSSSEHSLSSEIGSGGSVTYCGVHQYVVQNNDLVSADLYVSNNNLGYEDDFDVIEQHINDNIRSSPGLLEYEEAQVSMDVGNRVPNVSMPRRRPRCNSNPVRITRTEAFSDTDSGYHFV